MQISQTFTACKAKTIPSCGANVLVIGGTQKACEVCAPFIAEFREMHKYQKQENGFWMRENMSASNKANLVSAIRQAIEKKQAPLN